MLFLAPSSSKKFASQKDVKKGFCTAFAFVFVFVFCFCLLLLSFAFVFCFGLLLLSFAFAFVCNQVRRFSQTRFMRYIKIWAVGAKKNKLKNKRSCPELASRQGQLALSVQFKR